MYYNIYNFQIIFAILFGDASYIEIMHHTFSNFIFLVHILQ